MMNIDGSNFSFITGLGGRPGPWSADDQTWLMTEAVIPPVPKHSTRGIVIMSRGGSPVSQIFNTNYDPPTIDTVRCTYAAYSADSTKIFANCQPSDPIFNPFGFIYNVYSMNLDGSNFQKIFPFGLNRERLLAPPSPNGRYLAYTQSNEAFSGQLGFLDLINGGGFAVPLGGVEFAAWSPDSSHLLFVDGARIQIASFASIQSGGNSLINPRIINPPAGWLFSWPAYWLGEKQPVVFIPGIAGSSLVDTVATPPTELWVPPISNLFGSLNRLAALAPTTPMRATDVLRLGDSTEDRKSGFYGNFLRWMTTAGGYREYNLRAGSPQCDLTQKTGDPATNPNLFLFPYDWTKSNADNATRLKDYVQCVGQFYPNVKVNIVAHSMGGLLARRYILDHLSDHNVNKLITIGTPWLGAPKTIMSLETGLLFEDIRDQVVASAIKPVIDRSRGAHHLLPSESYFQLADPPFTEQGWDVNLSGNGSRSEIYTYNQLVAMLDKRFFFAPIPLLPGSEGKMFHGPAVGNSGQDDFRVNSGGVDYYHIYGQQSYNSTIGQVSAVTKSACAGNPIVGRCTSFNTFVVGKRVFGDGTVPVTSAGRVASGKNLNSPTARLRQFPSAGDPLMSDELLSHTGLLQNTAVYTTILSYLNAASEQSASSSNQKAQASLAVATVPAYFLQLIGLGSVTVTDSSGNSNAPIDGTPFVYPVPGVTYDTLGSNAVSVVMPANQIYTITFRSMGTPLILEITQGADDGLTQAVRYLDLMLPAGVNAQIRITPQGVEDMRYDANGDGTFESVVSPTVTSGDGGAVDTEAPAITMSGALQQSGVQVSINATDAGSGVKALYYSTDGATFANYGSPLTLNPSNVRAVYAFSDDKIGNRSSLQTYQLSSVFGVPVVISEETSTRAIALDSVVLIREPFRLDSPIPWGPDRRTRIMIFAGNFDLLPGENASVVTAEAEDFFHRVYPLTVEYVGNVPGYDWLNSVIVKLNDQMGDLGDVLVRIKVRGLGSNRVRLGVGHVGGGLPDDLGAIPTPGRPPQ